MWIPIKQIKAVEEIYPRMRVNWMTVLRYQSAMEQGVTFPPVLVGRKERARYPLLDGYHRLDAARKVGARRIQANIAQGVKKDYLRLAIEANVAHGLPMSPLETRRSIERLREAGYKIEQICQIVRIPMNRIERFVGDRVVRDGVRWEVLKATLDRATTDEVMASNSLEVVQEAQGGIGMARRDNMLFDGLLSLLKVRLLSRTPQNVAAAQELVAALQEWLEEAA